MEKMKSWVLAAILFCGAGCFVSCNGNANTDKAAEDTVTVADPTTYDNVILDAMANYLADSIGSNYAPGEVCIPVYGIAASKLGETPDSVFMWGDYWVFNYNVVGDTLKCVSGGNHPGKMLITKNENGEFQVVSFEQVEDGHGNLESAKRIFGEYYDFFHEAASDENLREKTRAASIADYVKAHKLPVKYYQDYGWPAKKIPFE
jgi:hypothetical protein